MVTKELYKESTTHVLAGFQLIEEQIKTYIDFYHRAAQIHLKKKLVYLHSRKDIEYVPLGKLIEIFSRINGNKQLIIQLKSLRSVRNKAAHKALVPLYGQRKTEEEYLLDTEEFNKIASTLNKLLAEILEETMKILISSGQAAKIEK